jgi:N-acetylglucosamine kinase-like BadF-type ATPase
MEYVIGVDGGGSKTEAASTLINGKLVKRHTSGSININAVGFEEAKRNLLEALEAVKLEGKAKVCVIGAAGLENERNRELIMDALKEDYAEKVILTSDAKIAYKATPRGEGEKMILICGTGSIAYMEVNGKPLRAGGWGYLLGDEGSGFWIARKAISKILRGYDEGKQPTNLALKIMGKLNVDKPQKIVEKVYGEMGIVEIAKIAEDVAKAFEEGDEEASEIMMEAAWELARLIKILIKRSGVNKCEVYCSGGVFKTSSKLIDAIRGYVESEYPNVKICKCSYRGVAGAILMAIEEAGSKVNEEVIRNIEVWANA